MEVKEYTAVYKSIPTPYTSRYSNTEIFEESGNVFRNTYSRARIEPSINDKITTIRSEEVGRLDLLAYRMYGNAKLYWAIAECNYILDPINEVTAGMYIRIPSMGINS